MWCIDEFFITTATPLSKMQLDAFTVSEILRLHLLASGHPGSDRNCRFRYQQRGGYTSFDDAGLELKQNEGEIMEALAVGSAFDLSPGQYFTVWMSLEI